MSFFKNLSVGERARIEAQLQEWSKQNRMTSSSWTINDDLTVDVNGSVWLSELDFEKLPVKFGKVTGFFSVYKCKNLTTMEGCPEEVGDWFDCGNCPKLTSLNGCPEEVGGHFWSYNCCKFTKAEVEKYCKVKGRIYV